jgi:hypothetical protein
MDTEIVMNLCYSNSDQYGEKIAESSTRLGFKLCAL